MRFGHTLHGFIFVDREILIISREIIYAVPQYVLFSVLVLILEKKKLYRKIIVICNK